MTLQDAVARAMASNPAIAAARLQTPVDVAGVGVARELPNPEVAYEASKETPRQAIGATFPIELGGKRQRRIDLAQATVATGEAELARVIAEVRTSVRLAYFSVVAADARVAVADDIRTLATRARDAAEARFSAGDAPQLDALQARLALVDAENAATAARGEATAARAELNALVGRPADAPVVPADTLRAGAVPTLAEAMADATRANVELAVVDRQIDEQTARIGVAKSLRAPDLAAGTTFTYHAQPEFQYGWRVSFGVTVPLFTRHTAGVLMENAELARLHAERAALEASIGGAVAAAVARATAAHDQVVRYEQDILPAAAEVERMAQDAYSAGQTGLVALLQTLQSTREIRQRSLEAGLDFQRALADLERAIGAPIR